MAKMILCNNFQLGLKLQNLNIFTIRSSNRFDGASFHQDRNDDLEMFNSSFVNVIEMSYWFVKFVENYESVYKTVVTERIDKSEEHLFTKVTGNLIKFSRFFLKYITSYEKIFKSVSKV